MKAIVDLAAQTLGPVLFVLLLAGADLGLVIGVMLLVDSARVMRWNEVLNTWVSTRKAMRVLDQPVEVKRVVYRWHRLVGVLLLAGAFFTLDALVFGFTTTALVRTFRGTASSAVLGVAFETLRIFLIVGNVAGLLAAVVLIFRPSLLKGLEGWADRYYSYSGRESGEKLDLMRFHPDEFVRARPKVVGALVVLGSAYALFGLSLLLR
jgi:hypothetical protein